MQPIRSLPIALCTALICCAASWLNAADTVVVNKDQIKVVGEHPLTIKMATWGPKWAHMGMRGKNEDQNGASFTALSKYNNGPAPITIEQKGTHRR